MYIVDLGLRNHILPRRSYNLGFSLENIVYFELRRRGYKVTIGKVGNTEVDFVAEKQGAYVYFQVTADMTAKEIFDREIRPLENIRDNYEKNNFNNGPVDAGELQWHSGALFTGLVGTLSEIKI